VRAWFNVILGNDPESYEERSAADPGREAALRLAIRATTGRSTPLRPTLKAQAARALRGRGALRAQEGAAGVVRLQQGRKPKFPKRTIGQLER
jgi:hypothetical protein